MSLSDLFNKECIHSFTFNYIFDHFMLYCSFTKQLVLFCKTFPKVSNNYFWFIKSDNYLLCSLELESCQDQVILCLRFEFIHGNYSSKII